MPVIVTPVALEAVTVRVDEPPVTIVVGLATILTLGGGTAVTVTVMLAVVVPPAPGSRSSVGGGFGGSHLLGSAAGRSNRIRAFVSSANRHLRGVGSGNLKTDDAPDWMDGGSAVIVTVSQLA